MTQSGSVCLLLSTLHEVQTMGVCPTYHSRGKEQDIANCLRHSCALNHCQVGEASLHGLYTNPAQPKLVTQGYREHYHCSHCCEHAFLPKKVLLLLFNCMVHSFQLSTAMHI